MSRMISALRPVKASTAVAAIAALAMTAGYQVARARLRRQVAAERYRATHDPLTGLLNRAGLADAWSALTAVPNGVALLDLDGFKPINDTHGHAAGDQLLVTIAGRLSAAVEDGLLARLGGDELVVVVTSGDAVAVARRVAAVVAEPVVLATGVSVSVTTSVGVTCSTGALSVVLHEADVAMYRAKAAGAGQVALYDGDRDDGLSPGANGRPAVRLREVRGPLVVPEPQAGLARAA